MQSDREKLLEEEAKFADDAYQQYANDLDINPLMYRKYSDPIHMWDWREYSAQLMGELKGKELLDFGCGMGEESVYFASLGANVTAIDISQVGIEITKARAFHNKLENHIKPLIMTVDPTEFSDESFDIIHGLGILHHIELDKGLAEIRRLLKPNGRAIFLEPLGNSPTVEWLKFKITTLGNFTQETEQEEALKIKELLRYQDLFSDYKLFPYHLSYRIRRLAPKVLHNGMRAVDYHLLRTFPFLQHFAGAVIVFAEK